MILLFIKVVNITAKLQTFIYFVYFSFLINFTF